MLDEIGLYLESKGFGVIGQTIFLGMVPDKPDACTALFEYAGSPPDLHWDGEYPGLQVRVRESNYGAGREKIGEAINLLHGLHETILSDQKETGDNDNDTLQEGGQDSPDDPPAGTRYLLIRASGSPELLRRDASDRVEFVVNFETIKEVKTYEISSSIL